MQEFRKKQNIEVVKQVVKGEAIENQLPGQVAECNGYLVQNKGLDSDRWVISTDIFKATYEKVESEPTTFVERLQVECKELVDKKVKLQAFFATPTFPELTMEEKDLLYEQERLMSRYIQILGKRIILAGSKYKVSSEVGKGTGQSKQ